VQRHDSPVRFRISPESIPNSPDRVPTSPDRVFIPAVRSSVPVAEPGSAETTSALGLPVSASSGDDSRRQPSLPAIRQQGTAFRHSAPAFDLKDLGYARPTSASRVQSAIPEWPRSRSACPVPDFDGRVALGVVRTAIRSGPTAFRLAGARFQLLPSWCDMFVITRDACELELA
jgi:hypothetical protein